MRLVKVEKPPWNKKTLPALELSIILLDLRNQCSGYSKQFNWKPRSDIAIEMYKQLEKDDKTHLFNVTNFDPNLLEQCRDAIRRRSMKLAYLTYDCLERLEIEQAMFLKKYLPIYPENSDVFIHQILENYINIKIKRGEQNASFKWE